MYPYMHLDDWNTVVDTVMAVAFMSGTLVAYFSLYVSDLCFHYFFLNIIISQ